MPDKKPKAKAPRADDAPLRGPSVPGDPDSLVEVDSPDDYGPIEREASRGIWGEYWPEPLPGGPQELEGMAPSEGKRAGGAKRRRRRS